VACTLEDQLLENLGVREVALAAARRGPFAFGSVHLLVNVLVQVVHFLKDFNTCFN